MIRAVVFLLFFAFQCLQHYEVQADNHLEAMLVSSSTQDKLEKLLKLRERLDNVERLLTAKRNKLDGMVSSLKRTKRGSCVDCKDELMALLYAPDINKGECYEDLNGTDYRGTVSVSDQGNTCQNWDAQIPHGHECLLSDPYFANAGIGEHNYCRNPDNSEQPWCFVMDTTVRSEYCDVGNPSSDGTCPFDYRLNKGAIHTIYGDTICPEDNELVYTGFVAGGRSCDNGGGHDYMCLPSTPRYKNTVDRVQTNRAYLSHTQFRNPLNGLKQLNNGDPPCAVCRIPTRTTILMIPGRNRCPDNTWKMEYSGYLFSQKNFQSRRATVYVCVHTTASIMTGTETYISAGNHIYHVEARCSANSAMPCENYIDGHELTCAVCSK